MAAQPLVRESYADPALTYRTNVMGTVNLFDAVRLAGGVRAVVNVTTDKCYENREWHWAYRENDVLGGYDPYSNSKACSELVTASFRNSFFNPAAHRRHGVAVASARAGNVIGGGDWAKDRLIPDCVRTLLRGKPVVVRNPRSVRPWQHVLEPLSGYLALAEALVKSGPPYAEAWNFGPRDEDCGTVESVVKLLCRKWGGGAAYRVVRPKGAPHEAGLLRLDHSKARERLGWTPRWRLATALEKVVEWTEAYRRREDLADCCLQQIEEYDMAGLADGDR
jgi:CDP-glucose 4,6-dehydratase